MTKQQGAHTAAASQSMSNGDVRFVVKTATGYEVMTADTLAARGPLASVEASYWLGNKLDGGRRSAFSAPHPAIKAIRWEAA